MKLYLSYPWKQCNLKRSSFHCYLGKLFLVSPQSIKINEHTINVFQSGKCANDLGGGKAKGQTIFPERKFKWQPLTRKEKYRIPGRPGGLEGGECNSQDCHYYYEMHCSPGSVGLFCNQGQDSSQLKNPALHNQTYFFFSLNIYLNHSTSHKPQVCGWLS